MYVHTICFRFIHTQEAKNLCKLCELVKSAKYLSTWADGTVTFREEFQVETAQKIPRRQRQRRRST